MSFKWKMSGIMFSVTMRSVKQKSSSQQFIILDNKALQRAEKQLRKWTYCDTCFRGNFIREIIAPLFS